MHDVHHPLPYTCASSSSPHTTSPYTCASSSSPYTPSLHTCASSSLPPHSLPSHLCQLIIASTLLPLIPVLVHHLPCTLFFLHLCCCFLYFPTCLCGFVSFSKKCLLLPHTFCHKHSSASHLKASYDSVIFLGQSHTHIAHMFMIKPTLQIIPDYSHCCFTIEISAFVRGRGCFFPGNKLTD